jgi:hypothetical protein
MPKTVPFAILALAVAACSGSSSLNCPAGSQPSGNFSLTMALQHTTDECLLTKQADGGPPPADASIVPASQPVTSTLCAGITDAGPTLYMLVANSGAIRSSPFDGGGFTFVSPTLVGAQTLCNCTADVNETISGTLLGAGDGGFMVVPDAGLVPQPTQLSANVVQALTPDPPDAGNCLCNMPCAEHYTLTGPANR